LKKEAGSELESIWLFEEPEAEAFFIKHAAGMWKRKRLNFPGSGSTLKKEAESGSKKYVTASTSLIPMNCKCFFCMKLISNVLDKFNSCGFT